MHASLHQFKSRNNTPSLETIPAVQNQGLHTIHPLEKRVEEKSNGGQATLNLKGGDRAIVIQINIYIGKFQKQHWGNLGQLVMSVANTMGHTDIA